ncbi:hypothetical protein QYM36_006587 [Artemia franciscana]|uniref:Uncharacterized protein n=1 Tax=Artemia franciscana TaxID=6661 RepID=A0AA88I0N0_ARTSF|nr:hypothetical protein QYM36_006587 [Artemia franciscana]
MTDPEVTTRKIFATWKQACGKTRGKTKDLFKKLRQATIDNSTSPEITVLSPESSSTDMALSVSNPDKKNNAGWRVHVWSK